MGTKVDIVDADDWKGLYIDNGLVYQDHDIGLRTLLSFVDQEIVECGEYIEADMLWFEKEGTFPKNLYDVVRCGENDPEKPEFVYSPIIV